MHVAYDQPGVFQQANVHKRLAEVFAPCFTLTLQLRASEDFGHAETLRRRIKDLLETTGRQATRMGASSEDVSEATFALIAFIDETILSSNWMQRDQWVARPLQLEYYNRYDAGEEFFVKLEMYLKQPDHKAELLEVFYMCMTLGFKGRYQIHEQERLRTLIEETYGVLRRTLRLGEEMLSPHGKPRDQVVAEVQRKLPAWIIAVIAAAIAVLVYFGLSLIMSNSAKDAVDEIQNIPRVEVAR